MPGDPLGVLERPAVRQIRRDPGRPEGVAAGRGREIRGRRAPLDHGQDETPRQRPARQPPPRGVDALEERRLRLVEPGRLEVVLKRLGRPMVAWLRSGRERLPPPPTATAPVVDSTRACSRPPRIRLGSSLRDVRRANTRALLLSCHDRALPELRTVATESSGTHTALVVRA